MTVTLLYFDGCPHWTTVEVRLRTALPGRTADFIDDWLVVVTLMAGLWLGLWLGAT